MFETLQHLTLTNFDTSHKVKEGETNHNLSTTIISNDQHSQNWKNLGLAV